MLITDLDITDQYVMIRKGVLSPEYDHPEWRVFHAEGGFGCKPYLMGSAVFGQIVRDGEECRIERPWIERLATPEEITAAKEANQ
jgi:hypothetical protein